MPFGNQSANGHSLWQQGQASSLFSASTVISKQRPQTLPFSHFSFWFSVQGSASLYTFIFQFYFLILHFWFSVYIRFIRQYIYILIMVQLVQFRFLAVQAITWQGTNKSLKKLYQSTRKIWPVMIRVDAWSLTTGQQTVNFKTLGITKMPVSDKQCVHWCKFKLPVVFLTPVRANFCSQL